MPGYFWITLVFWYIIYMKNLTFNIYEKAGEHLKEVSGAEKRGQNFYLRRIRIPNAKVLVVDDVRTNLIVAEGIMRPYGMRIDCVLSGQEAIDRVRRAEISYNLIFMDYLMPDMDGIEATRIIRREIGTEYAKTVSIIALTATECEGKEDMFLNYGFNAILSKPIDIMLLDKEINRWVSYAA